ncbi:PP2C family protein-serine/threonine phosphatase [Bradyrhizobium sp. SZCCHNR1051]|uniref:PP2C family protein-serine/threonine phosphatase n=1 Tax=Bradyrhizobium sp. SZCCHNR1051 TaxID=3057355 RepID=UPI00291627AB|nr:protein phosphatase 2C domain-containing protein [Bradyrhizobium sp. SZCCHNR1051]
MPSLEVAALTNVGLVRKINEDAILIGEELISEREYGPERFTLPDHKSLLIVADGMGGHRDGALASRTALSAILQISPSGTELWEWENAIHFANDAIYSAMDCAPSSRGMGTTIAGIAVGKKDIVHFNVGDSRVYRHSRGGLIRLSHDDVPLGTGLKTKRLSHQITQSLGGRAARVAIRPHVGTTSTLDLEEALLICSDGLTDMVEEKVVSSTIEEEPKLERCVRRLLRLALDAGGRDNISIIVARLTA